ncbi:DNA repair protein Xrs2p [Monosporozyma servazzii]
MWLIVYEYKGDNGSMVSIRSPMRDGQPVTIGRSNQCVLHIKNDKSISRKHIQFECKGREESLEVENFGKVTAYDNIYLKVGQKLDVSLKDERSPFTFSLGTLPVTVDIKSLKFQVIVSELRSYEVQQVLNAFCIELRTDPAFYLDSFICVVADRNVNPLLYLYAAIIRSPVVSSRFIDALIDGLQNDCSNMDTLYEQLLDEYELNHPNINRYVKDVLFIYLNKEYGYENQLTTLLANILPRAGGDFMMFDDDEQFESYLQLRNSLTNVVVIRHEERNVSKNILEVLGDQMKIYTTNEFLDKLKHERYEEMYTKKVELKHNVEPRVVPVPSSELIAKNLPGVLGSNEKQARTLEEPIEPSPVPTKKKRLTRRKVQPLNPLQLFAGGKESDLNSGTQLENIDKSIAPLAFKKETTKSPERVFNEKFKVDEKLDSTMGVSSENINPIGNSELNLKAENEFHKEDKLSKKVPSSNANDKSIISSLEIQRDEDKEYKSGQKEALSKETGPAVNGQKSKKHHLDTKLNKEGGLIKIEATSNEPKSVKRRKVSTKKEANDIKLEGDDDILVRKPTLVETIQTTKNKEVDRFRNNMVEVAPEELTEDAINEFSTLSIVEADSTLLKGGSQRNNNSNNKNDNDNGSDSKYRGRPNYKRFVKRWANGTSDNKESLRRSVDMFTRQYIETKPYSIMDKYTAKKYGSGDEDMGEVFTREVESDGRVDGEGMSPPSIKDLSMAKSKKEVPGLFIQSSDEEGDLYEDVPLKVKPLFHPSSDIEEDGIVASTQAIHHTMTGPPIAKGDNHVMDTTHGLPIAKGDNPIIGTMRNQPIGGEGNRVSSSHRSYNSFENSDDDSDDGPIFQFKSKKK